jgi:protoporphyrinogen oxidase
MAAAWSLARAGVRDVTIVERGPELGGLAGTFRRGAHFYPLGYHHILHHDRTLLYVLDRIGALPTVRWRRIRMFFHLDGRMYDLAHPVDFLRFPMSLPDKLRFAGLMLRCFGKEDWSDWMGRHAEELVDRWAGAGVREAMFERLTQLKFRLTCREVSAAWLGTRLYYREGSAPLGYIPGANWTKVLCDGITGALQSSGVRLLTSCEVAGLEVSADRAAGVRLADGRVLPAGIVVSTVPTEIYRRLVPGDTSPELGAIAYTAMISTVVACRQTIAPDFYWMNLASLSQHACGIFLLDSLNPTIGGPGERCVNFVTHLPSRTDPFFARSDEEILTAYGSDFRSIFGFDLEPIWTHVARVPMYSPIFVRSYRNPPVRSTSLANVYFAGNYRTFPSVASTGTAMESGFETAEAILRDAGSHAAEPEEIAGFRLRSQPRG